MTRNEFDQQDLASATFHQVAAYHLIVPIICPFDEHVGTNSLDEPQGIVLSENHHTVDAAERSQYHSARRFILDGQMVTFQARDRIVAVEPDNQTIAGLARLFEQRYVTGMQKVEASICETYLQLCRAPLPHLLDQ